MNRSAAIRLARDLFAAAALAGAPLAHASSALIEADRRISALSTATGGARLVELAEAHLERLVLEGADASALFGVPTDAHRALVHRHASGALAAAEQAAEALRAAIAEVEARPDFAESAELQSERSRLAVEFGALRRPLAHARALVLLSALERDGGARAPGAARAIEIAGAVESLDPASESRRRVIMAAGAMHARPAPRPGAPNPFDDALQTAGAPARARAEAALGRALWSALSGADGAPAEQLRAALARPPFTTAGRADPLLHVLAAETLCRIGLLRAAGAPTPEARRALTAGAVAPIAAILDRADLDLTPDQRRRIVFDKAEALARAVSAADAPPLVAFARARALARSADPAERAAGAAALQAFAAPGAVDPADPLLTEALWELAALRAQDPADALGAAELFLRIAAERPSSGRAAPAAEMACALAELALHGAPPGAGAHATNATDVFRRALRLAVDQHPSIPGADRWRYHLALAAPASDDERRALLESIAPGADVYARARCALAAFAADGLGFDRPLPRTRAEAIVALIASARAALDADDAMSEDERCAARIRLFQIELRAAAALRGFDAAVELLERAPGDLAAGARSDALALRALLRSRLDESLATDGDPETARLASLVVRLHRAAPASGDAAERDDLALAEALTLAGEAREALALCDRALATDPADPRALLARAEALHAQGDAPGAFAACRRVVELHEARTRSVTGDAARPFWAASSRMLQILLAQNGAGTRTAAIRAEIERLRRLDPSLGAEPFRARILAVEQSLPAAPPP